MKDINLNEVVVRSKKIRERYHQLERQHHGSEWTVEEDALAFLTDAALIGRLAMAQQNRWPNGKEPTSELEHKLGECIWWLAVLADCMNLDVGEATGKFLTKTEKLLGK